MSRKICTCEGCGKIAVSHGLCNTHRQRLRRHGSVDAGRPADWGSRESHPMWHSHQAAKRSGVLCEEWMDFTTYITAIGEKKDGLILRRLDLGKPFGPDNFKWVAVSTDKAWREDKAKYQRENRKNNPDQYKGYELKKRFGIDFQQYMKMHDDQGGVCAICGGQETSIHPRTGKVNDLSVDHDHSTGKIRALLCTRCNQGLGYFMDNTSRLEAAVAYLKQFATI